MRSITYRYAYTVTAERTVTVPDDFDPDDPDDGSALLDLVCELGDITGEQCEYIAVDERDVTDWTWE